MEPVEFKHLHNMTVGEDGELMLHDSPSSMWDASASSVRCIDGPDDQLGIALEIRSAPTSDCRVQIGLAPASPLLTSDHHGDDFAFSFYLGNESSLCVIEGRAQPYRHDSGRAAGDRLQIVFNSTGAVNYILNDMVLLTSSADLVPFPLHLKICSTLPAVSSSLPLKGLRWITLAVRVITLHPVEPSEDGSVAVACVGLGGEQLALLQIEAGGDVSSVRSMLSELLRLPARRLCLLGRDTHVLDDGQVVMSIRAR